MNLRINKIYSSFFILFMLIIFTSPCYCALDPPRTCGDNFYGITSPYGPRTVKDGSFFHPAVDYGRGAGADQLNDPIRTINCGTITGIDKLSELIYIAVKHKTDKDNTTEEKEFMYLHLFKNGEEEGNFNYSECPDSYPITTNEIEPSAYCCMLSVKFFDYEIDKVILFTSEKNRTGHIVKLLSSHSNWPYYGDDIMLIDDVKLEPYSIGDYVGADKAIIFRGVNQLLETQPNYRIEKDPNGDYVRRKVPGGDDEYFFTDLGEVVITAGKNGIVDTELHNHLTRNEVDYLEIIAPMGNSGMRKPHYHLDLRLGNGNGVLETDSDGKDNPLIYLNHSYADSVTWESNIILPGLDGTRNKEILYHTNEHENERIKVKITFKRYGSCERGDYNRIRIYIYPIDQEVDFNNYITSENEKYLINDLRDSVNGNENINDDPPKPNDPFRADFNLGGLDGQVPLTVSNPIDDTFPPFLNNPIGKTDGKKTGVVVNREGDSVYFTELIAAFNQWNTKVCKDFFDRNGDKIPDDAILNLDNDSKFSARYPDGRWRIAAFVEDIDYSNIERGPVDQRRYSLGTAYGKFSDSDNDDQTPKRFCIIDNFRPYLKKVTVKQTPPSRDFPQIKYEGEWKLINADTEHPQLELNQNDISNFDFVRSGEVIITLNFSEAIAFKDKISAEFGEYFPFTDQEGNEFYLRIDLEQMMLYYIRLFIITSPFYFTSYFNFTKDNSSLSIKSSMENLYYDTIKIKFNIPENDKKFNGTATLSVYIEDLAGNGLLELNENDKIIDDIPGKLHRNAEGKFNTDVSKPGPDTAHRFPIDTGPPITTASLGGSTENNNNRAKSFNPGVIASVIVEDELSKVAYVKIEWGNGNIFERIYDPPVEKVVEFQTYKQECEDKEYTIRVQSFDGAGNEQTNITIDGQEYPEVKFTVLALKADYHIGFVVNKEGNTNTVTAFKTDPCGRVGQSIAQIKVGNKPFDVAGRGDGRLYTANSADESLSIIDTQYDIETDVFEFKYGPGSQEYDPANDIDLGPGFTPHFIVITPDGSRAYVADKLGCIKTVNLIYWTDYFHPSGKRVTYPPHTDLSKKNKLYLMEGITGNIEDMAIDPAGRRLYVVVRNGNNQHACGGQLLVFDIEYIVSQHSGVINTFHKMVENISLIRKGQENTDDPNLNEPSGISFTPDGDLVYLTGEGTTEFQMEIQNWADATGGVAVIDPQAMYDPTLHEQRSRGSVIVDYIPPIVPGSKPKIQFIEAPRHDFTPFMGFGGGAASGAIYAMQEIYNSLLQDQMFYEFPVDIDGAESIVISPDGRRAYVTFFNTNNFGIIDMEPSFAPAGYSALNMPYHSAIYAVSEAILPSLNPMEQDPEGWDRFPNDISLSRDGRYLIISNRGMENDLVTLIDTHVLDDILTKLYNGNTLPRVPAKDDMSPYLTMDDLRKYPIDNLPTNGINLYDPSDPLENPPLIRYVGNAGGINDPEGICTIPSFDTDEDLKYGGSSDLVEAKNRFNSLLNLPECLSTLSLISSQNNNILSPCREDFINPSQAVGSPWGDDENNYLPENKIDTVPGKLLNGVLLPTEGIGYRHDYGYDPYNSDNAGTMELINLLEDVGRKWMDKHPEGPRIIYGDLSRPGGGQFMDIAPDGARVLEGVQRYAAHQNGLDVNIRYMRNDFSEDPPFDFVLSNNTHNERDNRYETEEGYHEEYTRELINFFLEQDEVEVIFVDPLVIELAEMAGKPFDSPRLVARGERANSEEGSRRDHDDHFSVRIQHTNHPPVAEVAADTIVATEDDRVELDGSASMDPDDHQLTYTWTRKDEGGLEIELDDPHAAKPTFDCPSADEAEELIFGLTVYDGELESPEKVVTISINGRPVATATADKNSVEPGEQVTLDASASYDPDGDEITYTWDQISGLPARIENFNESTLTLIAPWEPSLSESITLTFSLVVRDSYADSEKDTVSITVNPPPNNPPIADAGPDQHVLIGYQDQVTLDGYGSYDPDNGFLTYQWTQIAGPSVVLSDDTSPMPYCTITDITTSTTLTFSLVVNDGRDDSVPDTVNIKLLSVKEGAIVINEVVISPQQDWSTVGFAGYPGTGGEIDPNDQWIEIYNNSAAAIDLSGWSIMMKDSSPIRHYIGGGSGVEVFSEGSSLTNLLPGGFFMIGNPDGFMDNDCYIELLDAQDNVIDNLEIGDDYQEDGQGDGAPEPSQNGASTSYEDEAIARIRDGVDTDNDISDFDKSYATPVDLNFYEYPDESEY